MPVGAENLIRCTDQGRCTRKNVGTCRGTYVPHSVAPAVRQDPDGDLEILVSKPIGVFGTHRTRPSASTTEPSVLASSPRSARPISATTSSSSVPSAPWLSSSTPTRLVGAENLIWRADQGRWTRTNVDICRATYVPHSVAPAVRQDPDGDLEILVSNPIGVFGTHTAEGPTPKDRPEPALRFLGGGGRI